MPCVESCRQPERPDGIWHPLLDDALDRALRHWLISQVLLDDDVDAALLFDVQRPANSRVVHANRAATEWHDWLGDWSGEWRGVEVIYATTHALHRLLALTPHELVVADNAVPI